MSKLGMIGVTCALLSAWGIIQLPLMGVFYHMEAVLLIEDVHAHKYSDMQDFMKKTGDNYSKTAVNCYIAGGVYVVFMALSIYCIKYSHGKELIEKAHLEDQEYACRVVEAEPTEEKKKKSK